MVSSCDKGKRGELEVARLLRLNGFEARRGQQFSGGGDSPDVDHNIPEVHIEVKRTERLRLYPAMEQAERDADGKIPTVWHRANNKPWVVILPAGEFMKLMKGRNNGEDQA